MPTQKRVDRRTHSAKSVQPVVNVNESRGGNAETQFYRQKRWRDLRASVLRAEPFCRECSTTGKQTIATMVDHITPVKQGGEKYDVKNLQPLCYHHHAIKSAKDKQS
ncbi:HNH endonuclease [Spirosoma sp.]|uniref:HNH endonuclease n=1 Tax=Spirosoma sp. TaxID=1899569 RepID=UPI003B3B1069